MEKLYQSNGLLSKTCIVLLLFSLMLLGYPVFAQDEKKSDDEFQLEEITVTAEKREAQLQKTPMDIAVVRMDEMRTYGINQLYDLQTIIPQLSANTFAGNNIIVSIREIQQQLTNAYYETTVSTHLDGIQLTRSNSMENFFFDLARTEVLMGPQGTLYGRGTTAGTINMVTNKPVIGEFGGKLSVEGGNFGRFRTDWAINIPLLDNVAMRIAGRRNISQGYNDAHFGDADSWSHRVSFRWEPNDRLTVNLLGDLNDRKEHSYYTDGYYFDVYGDLEIVANDTIEFPEYQSGGPISTRGKVAWAWADFDKHHYVDTHQWGIQGSADYELDFGTLSVEYGFRSQDDYKSYYMGDARLEPVSEDRPATQVWVGYDAAPFLTTPINFTDTNTLEVRLASNTTIPAGDTLEWIVGAMAQNDEVRTGVIDQANFGYDLTVTTKTEGAFAQASWMPIPKWNFTGGLRMNWDKKDYFGIQPYPRVDGVLVKTPDVFRRTSTSWSELTYRANVSYIATDDIMPYFTYSKGYRSGNISFKGDPIPPEIMYSYELGLKSRFLDNKLQVNSGFYYYDYQTYTNQANIIKCWVADENHTCLNVADADHPWTGTRLADESVLASGVDGWDWEYSGWQGYSAGNAEQMGFNVDIQYLPTYNDRIALSATWRNNKYGTYNVREALIALDPEADSPYTTGAADLSGHEFGGAPIRGNVAYTHTFHFGSDMLALTGTAFYEGKGIDKYVNEGITSGTGNTQYKMPGRDDYWTASFNMVYSHGMSQGKMWSVRFTAQNIFDNDALSDITYSDDYIRTLDVYNQGSGTIKGTFCAPRTYSITLEIDF